MEPIAVASTSLTLVFGVLSVVFYFKSRRHRRLTLTSDESLLQTKDHPDIKISFRGQEIDCLWQLRAVCWNSGTDAVRSSDVPDNSAVTVTLPERARCLSTAVLASSHSDFQIEQASARILKITFTYLNPRDWGAFEVLYESDLNDTYVIPPIVRFAAPIIGGLPAEQTVYVPSRERWLLRLVQLLPLACVVLAAPWTFFTTRQSSENLSLGILTITGLICFQILVIIYFRIQRRRMWRFLPVIDNFLGRHQAA